MSPSPRGPCPFFPGPCPLLPWSLFPPFLLPSCRHPRPQLRFPPSPPSVVPCSHPLLPHHLSPCDPKPTRQPGLPFSLCLPAPAFPARTVPVPGGGSGGSEPPQSRVHPAPSAGRERRFWPQPSPGRRHAVLPPPSHQEIGNSAPPGPELPLLLPRRAKPGPWALSREKLEDSLEIINPGMARAEPSCPVTPCQPGTGHTPKFLRLLPFLVAPPGPGSGPHPNSESSPPKLSPQCFPQPHFPPGAPLCPLHPSPQPRNAERGVRGARKTRNVKKSARISRSQSPPKPQCPPPEEGV